VQAPGEQLDFERLLALVQQPGQLLLAAWYAMPSG
jgi:hypothetical protein